MITKLSATLLFALLTALAAQVRFVLPFTPVPLTGQVFMVLIGAVVLGRFGTLSQVMYLGMGASFGWFSGMVGMVALVGVTGGYLLGFVLAAGIMGELVERRPHWSGGQVLAVMTLGMGIIYALGAGQMAMVLGLNVWEALALGVLPFLLVDVLKILMASSVAMLFLRPRSA